MNKLAGAAATTAAARNLFEIEDEPDVSGRGAPCPVPDVLVGYNKSIWADIRRENYVGFGQAYCPQRYWSLFPQERTGAGIRMGRQWVNFEDLPFATMSNRYAQLQGMVEKYPRYDAGAVVAFFKEANSDDFRSFCKLLQAESSGGKILVRVEKLAAFANRPSGLVSWLKRLMSGAAAQPLQSPAPSLSVRDKLDSIGTLMVEGHLDEALDKLYPWIDGLLRQEKSSVVDSLFREVDVNTAPIDLIVGLLIGTLPVKRRMWSRASFILAAKTALTKRGEMEEGLFDGLE